MLMAMGVIITSLWGMGALADETPGFNKAIESPQSIAKETATNAVVTPPDKSESQSATLSRILGDVEILRSGSNGWQPASQGMRLDAGDLIRAEHTSLIELHFSDGSHFRLLGHGKVNVAEEPQNLSSEDGEMSILQLSPCLGMCPTGLAR